MEIHEFGQENSRKIVLIPGNMMCWKQFEAVITLLEKKFHVIAISIGFCTTSRHERSCPGS